MYRMRRPILFVVLFCAAAFSVAQAEEPPPPVEVIDDSVQPQVTIRQNESGEIVEEHRVNGKLYQVTVTPENGAPYTLIDPTGDGNFVPHDAPGSPGLSVPMWVIGTF
ncbi:MAG: DUF2782 domain-containing protein [Candidatus Accumulibacter sp.]|jgi:hypothetical protein|nr:DUF2782 domain-containing protein [Accumulibacter sp.]